MLDVELAKGNPRRCRVSPAEVDEPSMRVADTPAMLVPLPQCLEDDSVQSVLDDLDCLLCLRPRRAPAQDDFALGPPGEEVDYVLAQQRSAVIDGQRDRICASRVGREEAA